MCKYLSIRVLIVLMLSIPVIEATPEGKGEGQAEGPWVKSTFEGLKLRSIGPAFMSGRISDIAVDPTHPSTWFVAAASGGVWKTSNAGHTWKPIFETEGSYSIGCLSIDPNRPLTVWVGTGENNSQRSVGYGDGVYKSIDGGLHWARMGLENSEHIGMIAVDPRDSDVVYVAAQGPLWSAGGDRGLYKTVDGGKSWTLILEISENTGVNEVLLDPLNPDVLLASAYQRRRHVWTLINGGPESAIYRSADTGKSWTKIENGLPKVDMGRIGLSRSASEPDIVYAIVEAQESEGGTFRSMDGGINWERRSEYVSGSPQYYNELVTDPLNPDRLYSMDTFLHRSDDGGKTWFSYPEDRKHVDNHALWIDPANTRHLLAGCDGGLYESWDRGETWHFMANLPLAQFYKVTPDNDFPFYNVYGGTQDNATQGGPSRTLNRRGIVNADWYLTVFGDGFKTQIDPENPDIVYSQSQHGELVRFDRKNHEIIGIQPQPAPGEAAPRWNWDSPLIISPHSHLRLYFASQRVFRSDDRGNSWKAVSPDLTRKVDRNQLEVMGRVWGVDAVAKNASTSFYGNIVALSESPLVEGLIYAGTDDGLIQISEDGGSHWRKVEEVEGVPARTYVNRVEASVTDPDTVYVAFNNHKTGDFKPYLYKSPDRGKTWSSITGDLPERGSIYAVVQDEVDPQLLFTGTEFGLFFSPDEGRKWIQLTGGFPTIAVRDLEIQRREDDLVIGTFGRGIYILDDYSVLRSLSEETLTSKGWLFPVRKAWMYIEGEDLGTRFQGDSFFQASNPSFGAEITYFLGEDILSLKVARRERERKDQKAGQPLVYPSWEDLRKEDREADPVVLLTIKDAEGAVVRRIPAPAKKGFHRVAWDFRYPASDPVVLETPTVAPWDQAPSGPLALPGTYTVTLTRRLEGEEASLSEPQSFKTEALAQATLPARDKEELLLFQQKVARLQRAVLGAVRLTSELEGRINHIDKALDATAAVGESLRGQVDSLKNRLWDLKIELTGDSTLQRRNAPVPPSISSRVSRIVGDQWSSTSAITQTSRDAYRYAAGLFKPVLDQLADTTRELTTIEERLEELNAPWTPGRVPVWVPE